MTTTLTSLGTAAAPPSTPLQGQRRHRRKLLFSGVFTLASVQWKMASSSTSGARVIHPGSENTSVLHMQDKHVSQHIWNGKIDRTLKCRRSQQFHDGGANIPAPIVELLKESGFYWIAQLMFFQVDHRLITALVERWRPETHTFHMPFGECTITLQDVTILLGLPVDGMALVGKVCSDRPALVSRMLGSLPPADAFQGSALKMSWLNENFNNYPIGYEHNEHVKLFYARAYDVIQGEALQDLKNEVWASPTFDPRGRDKPCKPKMVHRIIPIEGP